MFFNMKTVNFKTIEELYLFISTHTEKEQFPDIGDFYKICMTKKELNQFIQCEFDIKLHGSSIVECDIPLPEGSVGRYKDMIILLSFSERYK